MVLKHQLYGVIASRQSQAVVSRQQIQSDLSKVASEEIMAYYERLAQKGLASIPVIESQGLRGYVKTELSRLRKSVSLYFPVMERRKY